MNIKTLRTIILFGTLLVFLYLVNTGIWGAEQTLENGKPVYLELAPVDPRSLTQGDYMALDYQIERDAMADNIANTHRGQVVARLEENNVAHYDRIYTGEPLAENEILLNYTVSEFLGVRIGTDSFFFQEGQERDYALAQYADVRVTEDGTVMLVDLVGENFKRLVEQN